MNHLGTCKKCYWKMSIETQVSHWSNIITYYIVQAFGKTFWIFFSKSKQQNKGFGMGTYTRILMIIDAIKVSKNAKMQIAQKLEKNGFWDKRRLVDY
jgi:tryptophan-rich sensory protein